MTSRPATEPDAASRVWSALHAFVAEHDRRGALRAELDLGLGKAEVLIKLADGPLTLREIARAVQIDPPAATVGVDTLEARGLVHRTPHPDDNRRKLVHLTDAGRAAARRAQEILDAPPAALIALGPEELARLDAIVAQLDPDPGARP